MDPSCCWCVGFCQAPLADEREGIIPEPAIETTTGQVVVGAVDGGPESDEDDGELLEFSDDDGVEHGQAGESSGIGAGSGGAPEDEEGAEPVLRNAPIKPDQEEVDRHYATHIPRRVWCRVCAGISGGGSTL